MNQLPFLSLPLTYDCYPAEPLQPPHLPLLHPQLHQSLLLSQRMSANHLASELQRMYEVQRSVALPRSNEIVPVGPPITIESIPIVLPLIQLSTEQVSQICTMLIEAKDIKQLAVFLWALPVIHNNFADLQKLEIVIRARVILHYYTGDYTEMRNMIRQHRFSDDCSDVREMWHQSFYEEKVRTRGKPLTSSERFRIRKQFPYPHDLLGSVAVRNKHKRSKTSPPEPATPLSDA